MIHTIMLWLAGYGTMAVLADSVDLLHRRYLARRQTHNE